MSDLEYRSFQVREAGPETRTFSGIAVPWDTPADIAGLYTERIERGAVTIPASGKVLLYSRHRDPIGLVTKWEDSDDGWRVEARISQTPTGDEAYTLLRDGVVDELSIGFVPIEHREDDETGDITRTRIEVRETSLVPFGAYGVDAAVTDVRSADNPTPSRERAVMPEDNTAAEVTELRAAVDEIDRKISTLAVRTDDAPSADTRSAGEILKAIVSGDESTIRAYEALYAERAYTGGTTADAIAKPEGIVNLVRIFDASSGVLADVFSTGTAPAKGNNIEFAEVGSNTIDVTEQAAEGDDITFGKVSITRRTAPIKTYAGGTQLTRQEIERATDVNMLTTSLEALATAAGARKKAVLRAAFNTLVTARRAIAADAGVVGLGATLAAGTAGNWEDALIDAALKFELENLSPEALIVSGTVFKKLRSLTVAGERVFRVGEKNNSGTLDLPGLAGDFAGIPVRLDSGQTGDSAVFVNERAIRAYDSPLVSLSDESLVNLSKSFAVYRYGAVAAEIPSGVVPVKLAAA
ncbi:HK97 family phage prohead protease [Microbacterium murale]|uniref:HK97 family phage prohead protease n=1 Tax=Microbacterium murale TaxID=1081040 RepID=A0ABU0PEA7_9MICO|nr:HK97 family phage prohead protease [Microbacterium murale]MDQ0645660.1 HK97 family phage prohead protease [Microbacterium murale]